MKQCLKCYKTYADDSLNFCLEDGEMLVAGVVAEPPKGAYSEEPPTVVISDARQTNPTNWPPPSPVAQWQPQAMAFAPKQDKTFPTIAMILGILSIVVSCCYGGFWLGLPAIVIGILGMRNADSDPARFGGRGMAITGLILGSISLLISLIIVIAAVFSR
jgi:hypothetical protein